MQMIEYLSTVPWWRMLLGWIPRSRPFDSEERCVVYRVQEQLHCAGFVCTGKVGTPEAVWAVDYYLALPVEADEYSWLKQEISLPRKYADRFFTCLVGSGKFHVQAPALKAPLSDPVALRIDVGADNGDLKGIEEWAELNRFPLDLITVGGVSLTQAWFHQQDNWSEGEVRIFFGDDGLGYFFGVASAKGLHSFATLPQTDPGIGPGAYFAEMMNDYVKCLELNTDQLKLWTAVEDVDWEKIKQSVENDVFLQNLVSNPQSRVKVEFHGPRIPDVGALRNIHPLVRNVLLSTLPLSPLV